ncbi:MAG: sugar isomerase domain-containing protein, partial [Bdellovibrionota bacterium]
TKKECLDHYPKIALDQLERASRKNKDVMKKITTRLIADVKKNRSLFVFGSGHSSILALELYHRAGGASFVIPLVADFMMPHAGPPVVRVVERTPGSANFLLARGEVKKGEMVWIVSQSGINGAVVDFAIAAKKKGCFTVAFTSLVHSQSVASRHPSGKKLYQVCDQTIDLCGVTGDAMVKIKEGLMAGPVSSLTSIYLAHAMITEAVEKLERGGIRCVYTSVNTPEGEKRNRDLEKKAAKRDPLLR